MNSAISRYGIALAAVSVMTVVRSVLDPALGESAPYLPFALAIMVAARLGGLGPGVAATALSTLGVAWFFLEPRASFAVASANDRAGLALFIIVGFLISLLVGQLRATLISMSRAEENLRRQGQLIDLSHDAIVTTDSNRRITGWNSGAVEMYGWMKQEALGKVIYEFLKTGSPLSVSRIDEVLLQEGRWEGDLEHVARDGSRLSIESRQVLVRDDANQPIGFLEINRDITERKRADERLKESESFYRQTLESIPGMVFTTRPDGYCDYQSQQWADYTGVPVSEHLGDGWNKLLHPDDRPRAFAAWRAAVERRGPYDLEYRVRRHDGAYEWFRVIGRPIHDTVGRIVRWFGVAVNIEEIKTAGEALRGSEQRLRWALEAADGAAWDLDLVNKEAWWSPEMYELFGVAPGTPMRLDSAQAMLHEADLERFRGEVENAIARRSDFHSEFRIRHSGHGERWMAAYGRPVFDDSGRPLRLLGITLDITGRKRAEQALRESEERLRLAQQVARVGTFEWNIQTGVNRWTPELEAMYGLPPGGFPGTQEAWEELVHREDRPEAVRQVRQALEKGGFEAEWRVTLPDGAVRWLAGRAWVFKDESGQPLRLVGVHIDITDRKQAEEAIRQAFEQRRLALESANLGAWDYRLDSGEVFWDQRCRDMFGVVGEDNRIDYADAIARIHADDRAATDQAVSRAIAGADGGAYHREFRVVWPDGSIHWIASHGRVFFEGAGEQRRAVRFVGVNLDVTERRNAEERLREAQKVESIGILAGGVAHDFNNILTVIMGSASSALEERPDCPHSQAVLTASERAAYLTKQLLAYAGKGEAVVRLVDLTDLVSQSTQLLSASVPKRVSLGINLGRDLAFVEADPTRIEQILMNLVINAGEAIPPRTGGRVEISTRMVEVAPDMARQYSRAYDVEPGAYVCLEVRDNGTGMDDATRSRIFDPFFSTKFTGRGLGLAAVYGIVRSSKGFIDVSSAPDRGTTFGVYLRASAKKRTLAAPLSAPVQQPHTTSVILVVDDEEMLRRLACTILRRYGYEVLEAQDGRHALQVLADAPSQPAAVLLDLAMPVMGGDELVPVLARQYPSLKIIMSSGYPEEEARKNYPVEFVAGFLQKPYTAVGLANKVREILSPGRQLPSPGISTRGTSDESLPRPGSPSVPPGQRC